jgi:hypothetical protein
MLLDSTDVCALLFIDQQPFCKQYAEHWWVKEAGHVIEVDTEIVEHFQLGKVPQWRFYLKANEVHHAVGTLTREEFMEQRNKIFGNLISFNK